MKINEIKTYKSCYGWKSNFTIDIDKEYFLEISTMKKWDGKITTNCFLCKTIGENMAEICSGDFNLLLLTSDKKATKRQIESMTKFVFDKKINEILNIFNKRKVLA